MRERASTKAPDTTGRRWSATRAQQA